MTKGAMGVPSRALRFQLRGADAPDPLPLFELGQPRWPEALAHYYFAAAGNDSFARVALGYRHMHGLGVPRSCQTAVLYYQPVAEQVVELARQPGSLPYVSPYLPPIPLPGLLGHLQNGLGMLWTHRHQITSRWLHYLRDSLIFQNAKGCQRHSAGLLAGLMHLLRSCNV